jgi:hypothetical protein
MSGPSATHIEAMKAKAVASIARQDGTTVTPDQIEFVKFEGVLEDIGEGRTYLSTNTAGQYLIVRDGETVLAVYKVQLRFGSPKAVRDEHGTVNYVVDSMSVGLKRIKRSPKGLVA